MAWLLCGVDNGQLCFVAPVIFSFFGFPKSRLSHCVMRERARRTDIFRTHALLTVERATRARSGKGRRMPSMIPHGRCTVEDEWLPKTPQTRNTTDRSSVTEGISEHVLPSGSDIGNSFWMGSTFISFPTITAHVFPARTSDRCSKRTNGMPVSRHVSLSGILSSFPLRPPRNIESR